jgi:hypothetical protein
MHTAEVPKIIPDGIYSPRQLAHAMGVGPQTIYAAIRNGKLRAAVVNDRGDLKITGRWASEFLEARSVSVNQAFHTT